MTVEASAKAGVLAGGHHEALTRLPPGATVAPDAVVFESRGVALVVGDDATVMPHAIELFATLKVVVCAPGVADVAGLPDGIIALGGRVVAISGRLGAFTARAATGPDASADIGGFGANADRTFDLVLDLSRSPHIRLPVPPLGYFAPGGDLAAIANAIATMRTLVGRFAKPRYFDYAPGLCAHGAQGKTGCTRCLDVCSTAAIRSMGDVVAVDPYLCQGCATCTLACPTGALSFRVPSRDELVEAIARSLAVSRDSGTRSPVLVVHAAVLGDAVRDASLPSIARTLEVSALPAFGEELWLAALAQGAAGVVLVTDAALPPEARELLVQHVAFTRRLLDAAGGRPARIALAGLDTLWQAITEAGGAFDPPARMAAPNARATKRESFYAALDAVVADRAPILLALPAGAPLGEVFVDGAKCTVCHACVHLCPTEALIAHTEPRPALWFVEANCVQCGLCVAGCPEQAIALRPRFAADPSTRGTPRLLHEDQLARCTGCGTPFIGQRLLESSLARLQDFPGLASAGGVARLRLCPACRQRATLGQAETGVSP